MITLTLTRSDMMQAHILKSSMLCWTWILDSVATAQAVQLTKGEDAKLLSHIFVELKPHGTTQNRLACRDCTSTTASSKLEPEQRQSHFVFT